MAYFKRVVRLPLRSSSALGCILRRGGLLGAGFSCDDKVVVSIGGSDGAVFIWRVEDE